MPKAPIFRFFAGKGGVGKTTCAAAAALRQAESGARVLVVSTDPAHSLGDALQAQLGPGAGRVRTERGQLFAAELDADRALQRWLQKRRRVLSTILEGGTYLDLEDVQRFLSLSLPGVDELLGLLELSRLARERAYEQVVVDTAPTGHTLRLLAMPRMLRQVAAILDGIQAKHRFLAQSLGGRYRPDEADALIAAVEEDAAMLLALLGDPRRCAFTWVLLPEELSLQEAMDGVAALRADGLSVPEVVVNRLTPPPPGRCPLCRSRRSYEAGVVRAAREQFEWAALRLVLARDAEPRSRAALRALGADLVRSPRMPPATRRPRRQRSGGPAAAGGEWLALLVPSGVRLVLFGGKGGVGKTTGAAATALRLAAASGGRVLILSADPAHSLADALQTPLGDDERAVDAHGRLWARELDAARALDEKRSRYREAVDAFFDALRGGSSMDATFDRAVARDLFDLAPPGMDELFAILAVTDALGPRASPGAPDVVVLDTAPTGHALRLLAMPALALDWVKALMAVLLKYRQVMGLGRLAEELLEAAHGLRFLQELLRDRKRTAFVAVTRPAELPRLETERLLGRLRRLQVPVTAVLVNGLTPPGCRRCRRTAVGEARQVAALRRRLRSLTGAQPPMILAPLVSPPPMGAADLTRWSGRWNVM